MGRFDFDQVFDEDYIRLYGERHGHLRSEADVDLIVELAGLRDGERVLDLPCGFGRIANRLAGRGFEVVGIDDNPDYLHRARRDAVEAGVEVDYRRGDMRALDAEGDFDVLVNWFTSFGYFDDDTDRDVLRRFRRALRPGGRLVLDLANRDRLVRAVGAQAGPATMLVDRGEMLLVDRVDLSDDGARGETDRIVVADGRVRRMHFSVRLFTLPELTDWLRGAGFGEVRAYGPDGGRFTWRADRLIVVASRVRPG